MTRPFLALVLRDLKPAARIGGSGWLGVDPRENRLEVGISSDPESGR
jgi:hypothetical protein